MREKFVPQFSASHLQGHSPNLRELLYVALLNDTGQAQPFGLAADQARVRVTAPSAQSMIKVGDRQFPPVFRSGQIEQVQQHDGVKATGHRYQASLSRLDQLVFLDGGFDSLWQRTHHAMVF